MPLCPYCRRKSSGRFLCDRCHAVLPPATAAAKTKKPPSQLTLPDGRRVDCSGFGGAWPADCWRCLEVADEPPLRVYALGHTWWADLGSSVLLRVAQQQQQQQPLSEVLAPVRAVRSGNGAFVVVEALPRAGARRP